MSQACLFAFYTQRNRIISFGDFCLQQLKGTAEGTPDLHQVQQENKPAELLIVKILH